MSPGRRALLGLAVLALLRAAPAVRAPADGDFAFEANDDQVAHPGGRDDCVKRLWGVPDMPAYVGHVFSLRIPREAFSGKVASFKVSGAQGALPPWLTLDSHKGLLRGLPGAGDLGEHRILVTAQSAVRADRCPLPIDVFTIEVKDKREAPAQNSDVEESCRVGEDESRLIILIGKPFHQITLKQQLSAITQLANFMGLSYSSFVIQAHQPNPDTGAGHDVVLMAGHGDTKKKHIKESSEIELTVGCSGLIWTKHSILVHQIKEQVRDGSISFVINLPVTGWKVVRHKQLPLVRKQRQIPEGSAYDEDDDDMEDGENDEYYNSGVPDYDDSVDPDSFGEVETATPPAPPPSPPPAPPTEPPRQHPHRHHHGEPATSTTELQPSAPPTEPSAPPSSPPPPSPAPAPEPTAVALPDPATKPAEEPETSTPPPSPPAATSAPPVTLATLTTQPPEDTTLFATTTNANAVQTTDKTVEIVPIPASTTNKNDEVTEEPIISNTIAGNEAPIIIPAYSSSTEKILRHHTEDNFEHPVVPSVSTTTESKQRSSYNPYFNEDEIFLSTDMPKETSSIDVVSISTSRDTTPTEIATTERSSTIIGRTTEIVPFTSPPNSPPQKQHRTKKVAVTAGKAFSYIIPEDMFVDSEDGTNLKLEMYDMEHSPLKSSSWVQFNPQTREVYGLPLEDNVSKWEYIIEATDSIGASVTDTLDITVQQHKGRRTVNHEFSMKLRILKKYPADVDWQIRTLKGLVNLFRDTDMDQITVREVDLKADPVVFIWTNDTLPRSYCPKSDIDRLMGILQSNSEGDPSESLSSAMSPELRIKSVAWSGTGACQPPAPTPAAPLDPKHPDNFSPMPRNQIDHINATAGKLLIFKVPEDSFYDPEDGSARNLKMWLAKGDGTPLSSHSWLQFDSKNQEFYGLPLEKDIGRKDYQLVCEDSGGLRANDGLLVEVHPAPPMKPTAEFTMTIVTHYDTFMQSANLKRKFIEKLYQLFNDKDASSIKIKSVTERPTLISWYNVSLPTDRCPKEDLNQLRKILVKDGKTITERVDVVMGDFDVSAIGLIERGACVAASAGTVLHAPEIPPVLTSPSEDPSKTVESDDYLLTFIIPIIVIICMIVIAALIACVLYKRRRSGKMSVGDDEERQAFRSKGIPVIFQDELDEKPDPSNKSPVIMKEEKPPLLPPPEYKGVDSSSPTPSHTPYHPPPPFTASRDTPRNSRPKPTPSYRKPPPYVPP